MTRLLKCSIFRQACKEIISVALIRPTKETLTVKITSLVQSSDLR